MSVQTCSRSDKNTAVPDSKRSRRERHFVRKLSPFMKQAQGTTGQRKAENILEWAGRINSIVACAMEIVNEKMIYAQWAGGRG